MCPNCKTENARVKRKGFFFKKAGRTHRVQRFFCNDCKRGFSSQTGKLSYRDHKVHLYEQVLRAGCAGVSQRRMAEMLNIHPDTLAKKLVRVSSHVQKKNLSKLSSFKAKHIMFDEMETFEHTKCKPLSIAIAVEEKTRRIIGLEVASMPAKGKLAGISRKKYGLRVDERSKALESLFEKIKISAPNLASLKSDKCPRYPKFSKKYFAEVDHKVFKGRRACVVGQGELKAGGFDPLFWLNHTCAMVRDNLKRLVRKTWCTTKKPAMLQCLLNIYQYYHNAKRSGCGRLVGL